MATLFERFRDAPYDFDFFSAVRLLRAGQPDRKPIGTEAPPEDEIARFRAHLSLAFPPSQIQSYDPPDDERPNPLITVSFLGLYGPSRVLPTHYTTLLLETHRDVRGPERRSFRDWLDLFNHRFISLFYRAWSKYRLFARYEAGEFKRLENDPFTTSLRSLMGFGSSGLSNRLQVRREKQSEAKRFTWDDVEPESKVVDPDRLAQIDDLSLIYYAGFFAQRPRNTANLRTLLADYFGIPVEIEPFQGQWLPVPTGGQTQLGGFGTLGVDAIVGERVWEAQSKFRIRLGPLDYPRFEELLPDRAPVPLRKTLFLVSQLARTFAGLEFDFDLQLLLKAEAVPSVRMAETGGLGPRLGWNTWVISETPPAPVGDAVFDGEWVSRV